MITGPFGLGSLIQAPTKRKAFVSYHHGNDQRYYTAFSNAFSGVLEVFEDKSLERAYSSDDADYVRWQIGQNDITGSSCTIVLCGAETHRRKYVDWEIKATLDKGHGLIGVWLPTLPVASNGGTQKPDRLQDNEWVHWSELTAESLKQTIEAAIATPSSLIRNQQLLRVRNG